jgi:DNA-binding response OmpR family regulator
MSWEEAGTHTSSLNPDLVVVDVDLVPQQSLSRCRALQKSCHAPVLVLTSDDPPHSAGDALFFLSKPLTAANFLTHVKRLLEEQDARTSPSRLLRLGELCLDLENQQMIKGGERKSLSPKLFDLLYEFMTHPGQVLTRKQIMKMVWDTDYMGDTRTLYVHIRWLREIIEDNPSTPVYLRTVRGVGYRFDLSDSERN